MLGGTHHFSTILSFSLFPGTLGDFSNHFVTSDYYCCFSCLMLFWDFFFSKLLFFFPYISLYSCLLSGGKGLDKAKWEVAHFGVPTSLTCLKPSQHGKAESQANCRCSSRLPVMGVHVGLKWGAHLLNKGQHSSFHSVFLGTQGLCPASPSHC